MKRLQIYIEEDLDEALALQAAQEHTSKAALIRRFVAEQLGRRSAIEDPVDALVGRYDDEPGSIGDFTAAGFVELRP
ncbi:MAG: ribbon-helix-helix protein, CopG family [Chloroflexi bacterium]|nr:ribbon-helix-helix protein, CopG family [Chloroflexota bacterium]